MEDEFPAAASISFARANAAAAVPWKNRREAEDVAAVVIAGYYIKFRCASSRRILKNRPTGAGMTDMEGIAFIVECPPGGLAAFAIHRWAAGHA